MNLIVDPSIEIKVPSLTMAYMEERIETERKAGTKRGEGQTQTSRMGSKYGVSRVRGQ